MPEMTPHIGLRKPLESETADISVINENMDKIDSALGDLVAVPTTAKTAAGAITELFTNVSDGKALIASAITDKGVPTDADDSFSEMADNIEAIPVGPDTSDATATAAEILAPKTAYGAAGKLVGTMPDRGNVSFTPGPVAQTIPAGKHGGGGLVAAVVVPADKVLAGTTIAGTAGTVPIRNGDNLATAIQPQAGVRLYYKPPAGYYDGNDDWVYYNDANFSAANILSGKSIFGLAGSLVQGKQYAEGSGLADSSGNFTVTGLAFRPTAVIVEMQVGSQFSRTVYDATGDNAINGHYYWPTGATLMSTRLTINDTGFTCRFSGAQYFHRYKAWGG